MVKHIVLWRMRESAGGRGRVENAVLAKQTIEAMRGAVPGLQALEVGVDFGRGEQSFDLALYAEFESRAALAAYQDHPAHRAVVSFLREVREERVVVDYEA
jgi:hypothetical protein